MVERFFRDTTSDRLRRGVFTSVSGLDAAISEYVAHHNTDPKPFSWTKSARDTLQKVIWAHARLSSKQGDAQACGAVALGGAEVQHARDGSLLRRAQPGLQAQHRPRDGQQHPAVHGRSPVAPAFAPAAAGEIGRAHV